MSVMREQVLLLLLLLSHESLCFLVISCVDTPQSFQSTWTPTPKPTQNDTWYYEGPSASTSQEIKIKYTGELSTRSHSNLHLYLEYLNVSPRRVLLETVKNGGLHLLHGDDSTGTGQNNWAHDTQQIVNEITITTILKKPQRLYLRKLIVFSKPQNAVAAVPDFATLSCRDLMKTATTPRTTTPPQPPVSTTTTRPATISSNKQCVTKSSEDQVTPECKCVCNCNCAKCN